jgi:hypothetical protein
MSAALLACSTPDATAPATRVRAPSFSTSGSYPAPELLSAELAGQKVGFSIVRLTFNDVATDETLVSARFTAADGSVMTQNIGGTTTTGQRVVDLYAQGNVASVKINYMFADPTTAAICGCTFGPYSATLSVASGSTGTTSNKGKGHK